MAQAQLTGLWYRLTLKVEAEPPHLVTEYTSQRIPPPAGHEEELTERELVEQVELFMNKLAAADAFSGTLLVPGTKMQYSNAGYVLLGAIIEKVSGENYFDYVRKHIFKPSGMTSTDFYETDIDTPNLATGYTNFEDKGEDYFEFHLGQRRNTSLYNGAKGSSQGGAFSTAEDLLRFSLALRGNRLISAKSLELMTTSKFFFRKYAADDVYYGYGFELQRINGMRVIGHGGGDLGISSGIRWYPDSGNYTFAVLSNYDRGGIITNDKLQELIIHSRK